MAARGRGPKYFPSLQENEGAMLVLVFGLYEDVGVVRPGELWEWLPEPTRRGLETLADRISIRSKWPEYQTLKDLRHGGLGHKRELSMRAVKLELVKLALADFAQGAWLREPRGAWFAGGRTVAEMNRMLRLIEARLIKRVRRLLRGYSEYGRVMPNVGKPKEEKPKHGGEVVRVERDPETPRKPGDPLRRHDTLEWDRPAKGEEGEFDPMALAAESSHEDEVIEHLDRPKRLREEVGRLFELLVAADAQLGRAKGPRKFLRAKSYKVMSSLDPEEAKRLFTEHGWDLPKPEDLAVKENAKRQYRKRALDAIRNEIQRQQVERLLKESEKL
jgi:hypothetical protein